MIAVAAFSAISTSAQTYEHCPFEHQTPDRPDLVACEIPEYVTATVGSRTHVTFDWTIDNQGSAPLFYAYTQNDSAQYDCHPVFIQSLYRFQPTDAAGNYGGRFEQIGTSWLKHGATAPPDDSTGRLVSVWH
jgi:hypothetical protein